MKRIAQWMFAAILICGASVFASCSNFEDNPVKNETSIAEKMKGVWKNVEIVSGISPITGQPFDKIINSYIITPDGFGLYDEIYFNGDKVVDKYYDRHINGHFSYREFEDGLLCMFSVEEQGFLKYDNGRIIDLFDEEHPYVFTKCDPDESLETRQKGVLGIWRNVYEESGKTPNKQLSYDRQIETYYFAPDGTGFFESIFFNGELLVEKEYDRFSNGRFVYEWVNDNEIICLDFETGALWRVTYDRGVFTDLEDPNNPITYNKIPFEEQLRILNIQATEE